MARSSPSTAREECRKSSLHILNQSSKMFRVGLGYDAHRLVEGRQLTLGGVEVPHVSGLEGHSDADVLTHAAIDAVLGAMGMGDIGQHFPDSDPTYQGVASLSMLRKVMAWVKREGFRVNNLDATIVAERPKLAAYLPKMRENIANVLEAPPDRINIKATTTEGLGYCGRSEGMEAFAIVSLVAAIPESEPAED